MFRGRIWKGGVKESGEGVDGEENGVVPEAALATIEMVLPSTEIVHIEELAETVGDDALKREWEEVKRQKEEGEKDTRRIEEEERKREEEVGKEMSKKKSELEEAIKKMKEDCKKASPNSNQPEFEIFS